MSTAVRSAFARGVNGLDIHYLEAGFDDPKRPCILLLHGFPELAFSWRAVMPILAEAGYHVIAPDQRGYGQTVGWDGAYDTPLHPYGFINLARDAVGLVHALGHSSVAAVVGHDFGSPVAGFCALIRPDVFRSVVLMSAPFPGPPPAARVGLAAAEPDLAALPRPRKHYQTYFGTRGANADLLGAPQGLHDFLRAYFHQKSGEYAGSTPFVLANGSAEELAKLPDYYVMDLADDMPTIAARAMPSKEEIEACRWLTEDDLAVYVKEFTRTGFQGALNWYRCRDAASIAELRLFSGSSINVPATFIAGERDWGVHQAPGAFQRMQTTGCTNMRGVHLIAGAGHWVQQERPAEVADLIVRSVA